MKSSGSFKYTFFILFLLLNFGALALGGLFTGSGVTSEWYENLNQAPWTPPGWVFGAAWTIIMFCYSIYLALSWQHIQNKTAFVQLYVFQWVLNVCWNPMFFYFHQTWFALAIILTLTFVIGIFLFSFPKEKKGIRLLMLPYFLWLLIATSLNGYICFYN